VSQAELLLPSIMLVTDRRLSPDRRLDDIVAAAVEGGVNAVQIREKDLSGGELFTLATRIKRLVGNRALVLVNDRVDVALAAEIDGVQLGESALGCALARKLGPNLLIGRSVHDSAGAAEAVRQGADFLLVGSMFQTSSHPGAAPAGPPLLRRIAGVVSVPLVGIGGIRAANAAQVIAAGASGAAVISKIMTDPDPRASARRLASAVADAWETAPLHRRRS
jgi:thiamine-phosphate pyrophosphorylase